MGGKSLIISYIFAEHTGRHIKHLYRGRQTFKIAFFSTLLMYIQKITKEEELSESKKFFTQIAKTVIHCAGELSERQPVRVASAPPPDRPGQ